MIGIKYVNDNNRIMEDRIANSEAGDGCKGVGSIASSKKPSLLRSQLLRRTTTRTKKRPPTEAVHAAMEGTTTEAPVNAVVVGGDTRKISQSSSNTEEEDTTTRTPQLVDENSGKAGIQNELPFDENSAFRLHHVHHNAEYEIKNGANLSNDGSRDDGNCSLDISIIESEDDDSGVELSLIQNNDESKSEVESDRPLMGEETPPPKPKTATSSAVATTNLSIVVKGNDIVVEYRDDNRDERKESSPQVAAPYRQPPTRRRPKGIMKRPRDSNITYHHPRRPLPPPLPPPGYSRENSSPVSCATATSTDSSYASTNGRGHYPPLKKRVSFNEKQLFEQYQMSRLRRKEKYEKRRSFLGILSMAMPVVMPYLMAVLILVASSMVPLPTDQRHQQSLQQMSLEPEIANVKKGRSNLPSSPPILIDVGSRMWEERRKAKEEAAAIYNSVDRI